MKTELLARLSQLNAQQRESFWKALQDQVKNTVHNSSIPERPARGSLSLSFAQERLWFINQLDPESPFYNVGRVFHLEGDLSVDALRKSLTEIARRHGILRTKFPGELNGPVQQVAASVDDEMAYTDVRGADAKARAYALATDDVKRPFNLTSEFPWRARLIQYGDVHYLFSLVLHHIVVDGWSLPILFREMSQLYGRFRNQESCELEPLSFQYAQFALWERKKWAEQNEAEQHEHLAYWRKQLQGLPNVLPLPTDFHRPSSPSHEGALEPVTLSAGATSVLTKFAADRNVSLATVLLAGFQALLARYMAQDDFVVAQAVSNRGQTEFENLIGLFVNTLPLRADLSGRPTFAEFVEQVHRVAMEAYAYWHFPFEMILKAAKATPQANMTSLTQIMFGFDNFPDYRLHLEGVTATLIGLESIHSGGAKADLELSLSARSGHLAGVIAYKTDLFCRSTIQRFGRHLAALLERGAMAPATRVDQIPILSPDERHQVVSEWNKTSTELPREQLLAEMFEQQVELRPDATALSFERQSLSYRELNRRANQLARYLRHLGVDSDVQVGVFMERSIEMVVALLGILKAGGAYVPLDPEYPADRLSWMIEDSGVGVVLTQLHLRERMMSAEGVEVLTIEALGDELAGLSVENLHVKLDGKNLAYVIYTSGSTGRPKGVMNTQGGIANRLLWMQAEYGLSTTDVVVQKTPYSFDVSVWEFFWPLLEGATLVIARPEGHKDPAYLAELIQTRGVTTLHFVPPMLNAFLQEPAAAKCHALRRVICSGEALSAELQKEFFATLSAPLHNLYGPTEAAVDVSYWACGADDGARRVPIGRPIWNTQMYVLDEYLEPLPVGVVGELYIAGAGLARGYLRRPGLTAERFIADPYAAAGGRMYRTGDLARWRADGVLEYLGRTDQQVKLRGFRVELGEIENALLGCEGVLETVVVAREDTNGPRRLAAYLVSKDQTRPTASELRTQLQTTLPEYMVPAVYVFLDALPLNHNGKVDRKALPAPVWGRAGSGREFVGPRNDLEEMLASIWSKVLNVEKVGVHDNFFELGGDSLLATQVVVRTRARLKSEFAMRWIFEAPTIAGLAERWVAAFGSKTESRDSGVISSSPRSTERLQLLNRKIEEVEPPTRSLSAQPSGAGLLNDARTEAQQEQSIVKLAQRESFPLSFGQQRLWFIDRLTPESSLYNVPIILSMHGALDIKALTQIVSDLSMRHEVLRTRYVMENGQLRQKVEPGQIALEVRDCSNEGEAAALSHALREASRPFDLETGPLFRALLLRVAEQNHIMVLNQHHSITDGWSLQIMSRELKEAYEARLQNREPSLAELPIQYGDFAAWHMEWIHREVLPGQLPYWRGQLEGAVCLELPCDQQRSPTYNYRGAMTQRRLPRGLNESLRDLGRAEGSTFFMTLLAAFQALLARYTGQTDISVGTPIANRNRIEVEPLIGFFVNTLVMRTRAQQEWSFRRLLREVREVALGAYAHQDVPFEKLVEELQPERDLSHTPLFQVLFAVESAPPFQFELQGLRTLRIDPGRQLSKFDLAVAFVEDGNEAALTAIFRTDLFERVTIDRLLTHFECLLQGALADPNQMLYRLPLMNERERRQMLLECNQAKQYYPSAHTIHEMFEGQVERRPAAVAVVCDGRQLTYRELNVRANQLARHLRHLGVGPEALVGVCVERGVEMIVGLIGILKAGGAYLPLDPGYPAERLRFMLEDGEPIALLTEEPLLKEIPEFDGETVCLDRDWHLIARQSEENLPVIGSNENLAYVIYTSGSTGQPKGVMISHYNVVRLFAAAAEHFAFSEDDVWSMFHSYSFDFSVWEMWGALLYGGRLVMVPYWVSRSPDAFHQLLCEEGVTILNQTPSAFRQLMEVAISRGADSSLRLREVIFGGEALELSSLRPWFDRYGEPPRLVNMYGITETTVHVTYCALDESKLMQRSLIGTGLKDLEVYVLDQWLTPVPKGLNGELYVGGDGLARGYLRRAALTAERFVPDPYSRVGGARIYRTGDEARYRNDGSMEYIGRLDHQVKLRGYRIELGEIEAALREHKSVREAVVLSRDDGPGGNRLVGYVVAENGEQIEAVELRRYLQGKLPEYMIPQGFVTLEQMPLTSNGKIDRKSLLDIDSAQSQHTGAFTPPTTQLECRIAPIWEKFLRVEKVGIDDNFFDLGGHSLLAAQVSSSLKEIFPDLTLIELFSYPTIRSLAQHMSSRSAEVSATDEGASRAELRRHLRGRQRNVRRFAVQARAAAED